MRSNVVVVIVVAKKSEVRCKMARLGTADKERGK
jgi:hypothetical protein